MENLYAYFNSNKLKIFYTEGGSFADDDLFMSSLDDTCYVFFQFTWNIESNIDSIPWHYESRIASESSTFNFKKQFIFCAPTLKTYNRIVKRGYSCILLNHNCLLDYNLYTISPGERKYNAVINSRPFWWKRVFLAEKVDKLAYIAGDDWANDETSWTGYKEWKHANYHQVHQHKVNEILNNSCCGLILSGNTGDHQQGLHEGANYSSSEYLLCGLPVITTPSQGGRDYWFDDYNSITCEPSQESVREAVNVMVGKLKSGEITREKIRSDQITKMNQARKKFIEKTQELFNIHQIKIDASQYFSDNYFHKLCNYKSFNYKKHFKPLKFLALDYECSNNIGDWVQTIAACQFYPEVNALVERDGFRENKIDNKFNNVLITNGWYWGESNLEYLSKIDSIIPVSIHINDCGIDETGVITHGNAHKTKFMETNKHVLDKLTDGNYKHVIGTRDKQTKDFLDSNNITSILTNCMTLTLQRSKKLEKKNHIIVDDRISLNDEILSYLNTKELDIINLDIENVIITDKPFKDKLAQAKHNLDLICQAQLVISSRLHVVLPSISLGTRAIYTAGKDTRHGGYEKLIKYWIKCSELKVSDIKNILADKDWLNTDLLTSIRDTLKNLIRGNYQVNNDIYYDNILDKVNFK